MTVLSFLYAIIMYRSINAQGRVNNAVDGINTTDKLYLNGKWDLLVN